ncbi:NAD(P)-binding protein [Acephala macrosclerotiorum]|nr:NAD(P)-binding protein [Acephala macrosclerotiorum]
MIILTVVTSSLGSAVLATILDQNLLSSTSLRVSSYSSNGPLLDRARSAGIEIRHSDITKPSTPIDSYSGVDALFLISYLSVGEERFKYHKIATDAVKEVGVKHILYSSLTWGGPEGKSSIADVYQAHLKTTNYLEESGPSRTIIREATYAHLWNNFAGFMRLEEEGGFKVVVSNDGKHHFANRKELGEAAAKIVANHVRPFPPCTFSKAMADTQLKQNYVGQMINLTGPKPLSVSEIVTLYATHSGRKITFRKVRIEEAVTYHRRNNSVPVEQRDFLANWASWGEGLRGEK